MWLDLEEWWYKTTYHKTTKMKPYEPFYGQQTPFVVSYLPSTSKLNVVDSLLQNQEATL